MNTADILLRGNTIFTGWEDEPMSGFLAIKNEKIIAVEKDGDGNQYIGTSTKVYDFKDQLIMPGFHDAHLHLMLGSLFTDFSIDLSTAASSEEVGQKVKEFAREVENGEWIIGNGWDEGSWEDVSDPPHRNILDKYIPDTPMLLIHAEGHYAWVNSKALEIANLTPETPNPPYGDIQKDENGELTGVLLETAVSLVSDKALVFPRERQYELMESFLKHAAKSGVTSVNDLYASRALSSLEDYEFYKEFENKKNLTVRIHLYPALDGNFDRVKNLRESYNSPKLKFTGLKQFIDGVVTGYTAFMLDPYKDRPETKGETAFSPAQIKEWVIEADKEEFQIRFHSIGDGAVRLGLDAFENAQIINGKRDSRHALEHIEVIHPDDIKRFKTLGVIPSIQPSHLALMPSENHTLRVGSEKDRYAYTCKSLYEGAGNLAFGTDFPISPLDPIKEIYYAVNRKDYTDTRIWNEQERIPIAAALKAYTSGSAHSVFRDHELGTLEPGKLADIIVLDKDLFSIPTERIRETKVLMTIMDGDIVFEEK
ncbi:amidohydrolase [Alteribacillus sp. YIM 98480]|uniref:amidohydrolase n=1 Tax=Alteribacillus sp. YIM 98480 TaxID=2606599 RepID=UPI00131E61CF|nr:amidohydrolase [Alteribacillus sp. YIM 98480]